MAETTCTDVMTLVVAHPLRSVSNTAGLSQRLEEAFSTEDQQQFLLGFYMFQNNHETEDYVIDLESIFEWLGYSTKAKAKDLLVKHFIQGKDYIKVLASVGKRLNGGQNKETIMMNIETFTKMCLKANTKKADSIHNYHMKLQRVIYQFTVDEKVESERDMQEMNRTMVDLKQKLDDKGNEKLSIRERTLIESFDNKPVVYLGSINSKFIKFGYTSNIKQRTETHKREIGPVYTLHHVVECEQNIDLEDKLKQHNDIHNRRCKEKFNGKMQTELIRHDQFMTIDDVAKIAVKLRETITIDKEYAMMKHREKMTEELTKQTEELTKQTEELTKQKRIEELTKQKELELEMKRLEMEMKRMELQSAVTLEIAPQHDQPMAVKKQKPERKSRAILKPLTNPTSTDDAPGTSPAGTAEVMLFLIDMWSTSVVKNSIIYTMADLHNMFIDFLKTKKRYTTTRLLFWGKSKLGRRIAFLAPEVGVHKIINYGPGRVVAYGIDLVMLGKHLTVNGIIEEENISIPPT